MFVFFLTFFFLALITKKYKVEIHKIGDKVNYEKIEVSKGDKFLFQNKTHFIATLITLFLTYGFLFYGFKMSKKFGAYKIYAQLANDFQALLLKDEIIENNVKIFKVGGLWSYEF